MNVPARRPLPAGFLRPRESGPVVWALILLVTCLLLAIFQRTLWLVVPFLGGVVIHYVLRPLKRRCVLAGLSHEQSAVLVSAGAFLVVGAGLFLLWPWLAARAVTWQDWLVRYVDGGLQFVLHAVGELEGRFYFLSQARLAETVREKMALFSATFANGYLAGALIATAAFLPSLLLAPFLAFFFLRDGWRLRRLIIRSVPNAYLERSLSLLYQLDQTATRYFTGLLALTALDTLALATGLWVLGLPQPFLLALVAAVLAWVPFIGSIVGCSLVVVVAATDFPQAPALAYGAILLFLLVRLLDDFLFMPLTVGRSLQLHPVLTVLMIFVGGAVAGVTGLMLVLPLLGMVRVVGETLGSLLTDSRLRARHAHERELRRRAVTADLG